MEDSLEIAILNVSPQRTVFDALLIGLMWIANNFMASLLGAGIVAEDVLSATRRRISKQTDSRELEAWFRRDVCTNHKQFRWRFRAVII